MKVMITPAAFSFPTVANNSRLKVVPLWFLEDTTLDRIPRKPHFGQDYNTHEIIAVK
jgi:hypothetical protein